MEQIIANQPPVADGKLVHVGIIEDKRELREGLMMLINGTPGYRCVQTSRSMEEALTKVRLELPDVMLVDIGLPGMSGIEGMKILKERYPELLVVALTVFDDDDNIFAALCAGASGYVLKKTPPARLLENLKELVSGGAPISPEVAARVIKLFKNYTPPAGAKTRLTQQETEILKLLVEGHNYKTAAAELEISSNTVAFHLRNIYQKLQVHSKSEAVAKALRMGLV
jgi:DNA-binding NarL/FixJ family response regulator